MAEELKEKRVINPCLQLTSAHLPSFKAHTPDLS